MSKEEKYPKSQDSQPLTPGVKAWCDFYRNLCLKEQDLQRPWDDGKRGGSRRNPPLLKEELLLSERAKENSSALWSAGNPLSLEYQAGEDTKSRDLKSLPEQEFRPSGTSGPQAMEVSSSLTASTSATSRQGPTGHLPHSMSRGIQSTPETRELFPGSQH